MQRQIEMTWVCSSCSTRNLGRYTTCQQCSNPKDDSEPYEMPSDTAAAASVTDPALLRMAHAGPNWKCQYCGYDQRRLDNTCGQCGAGVAEEIMSALSAAPPTKPPRDRIPPWVRRNWIGIAFFTVVILGFSIALWMGRERTYKAKVVDSQWERTIIVERYQVWTRDGFRGETDEGAFDIVSRGQQIHHYDHVFTGYTTESYTEQEACGEDCSTTSQSCREECSSNGNGFATCTTHCTGGGRVCTTRYCTRTKTRQVEHYRDEPRYAEGVTYKIWDWGDHRTVHAKGHGDTGIRWPDEEAKIGQGLADRERERDRREESYFVTIGYGDKKRVTFEVRSYDFKQYAIGTEHDIKIQGDRITLDDFRRITPVDKPADDTKKP